MKDMLLKIAYRNVVKYWKRNLFVFGTVFFSILLFGFAQAFIQGFKEMSSAAIFNDIGHVMVYQEGYYKKSEMLPLNMMLDKPEQVIQRVKNEVKDVQGAMKEIKMRGVIIKSGQKETIVVRGIELGNEKAAYSIRAQMKMGRFAKSGNEVVLGNELAEFLKVKLNDTVELEVMNEKMHKRLDTFKVVGVFETGTDNNDRSLLIANIHSIQQMLGLEDKASEISFLIKDPNKVEQINSKIKETLGGGQYDILPWTTLYQGLHDINSTLDFVVIALLILLVLVVATGIANVQLISAFERIRDIGTLRAIGMGRWKVFYMMLAEAVFIGFIAAVLGCLCAGLVSEIFSIHGIYLGATTEKIGLGNIVYPHLTMQGVIITIVIGVFLPVISVIYPALVVSKKRPIEALHDV
ncbi:ABC transporter permease [Bacillus cytotoxicus]